MIRPLGKFVLAFSALALLASPAWAQARKGGGGFGMGGGAAAFLMAPNVQKDLKLSDEQIGKVRDTLTELREKHADDFTALRDASPEDRPAKAAALAKTTNDEVKKALSFSDEQSKRFDQIGLQARGAQAFSDPTVQAKLKLTDDQKGKLREIAEAARQGGGGGGGFANLKNASDEEKTAARKKMVEARQENLNKVLAVLTDDQKKEWKEMTGETIELTFGGGGRRPNN
jgi:Spy/CpxP family protein refolding chaperone